MYAVHPKSKTRLFKCVFQWVCSCGCGSTTRATLVSYVLQVVLFIFTNSSVYVCVCCLSITYFHLYYVLGFWATSSWELITQFLTLGIAKLDLPNLLDTILTSHFNYCTLVKHLIIISILQWDKRIKILKVKTIFNVTP